MSELILGTRTVGYYGESQNFSISTNTNSLSLGITLQSTGTDTNTGGGSTDTTPPVISGSTITTPTNDNTPDFIISSSEAGTITYGGSCSSSTTSAIAGSITVTFNTLSDGIYDDCTFRVTDSAGNVSNTLTLTTFIVDLTAPAITGTTVASNNASIAVTFSEAVYNTSGGSGALEASDFTLTLSGGTATLASATPSSISSSSNTYTLGLSLSGTPNGSETITVVPSSSTAIYDAAGNAASTSQSNNTVTLNDKTVPTLSSVSIASNNSTSTLAAVGDNVTLSFTASETISTPVVTFVSGGAAITDTSVTYVNTSGNIWTAAYTTADNDTTGSVAYSIAFSDSAGNAGSAVTSGGGSVTFDKTAPTLSSVSIASNNSTSTLAAVGNVVTLTFTASETISTPVVTFISGGAAITDTSVTYVNTSGNTWTAVYTTESNDTTGSVAYSIAFSDSAGSAGTAVTSGGGSVTFDKTAPTLSSVSIASNNSTSTLAAVGDNVTLTFTASETISTPVVTFVSGGAAITDTSVTYVNTSGNTWTAVYTTESNDTTGSVAYSIAFSDSAGSAGSAVTSGGGSVTFDKTAPTLSSVSIASNNSTSTLAAVGDNVTLTFTASETISTPVVTFQSGGAAIQDNSITYVNTSGNIWTAAYTTESSDTTGSVTYSIAFSDSAGNAGTAVTSGSGSVTFDNTAPTAAITYSYAAPYKNGGTNVTITATFNGAVLDSPVPTIAIAGSGTLGATSSTIMTKTSSTVYTYTYTVPTGDGTGTVTVGTGTDAAGNVVTSTPTTGATFTVDNTAPTAAITYSYAAPYKNGGTNVTITATFNGAVLDSPTPTIAIAGSGIANVSSANMSKTSTTVYTYTYAVPTGDGTGTVTVGTGTDAAGNVVTSTPTSGATFTVDNTVPTLSSVSIASNNSTTTLAKVSNVVTLTFTASETIATPVVTFQSGGAAITASVTHVNTSGNIWTAAYTANASDTEGSVTYSIAFSDSAGNAGTAVTSGSGSVTFDKTAPTVSSVTTTADNQSSISITDNITVTFSEAMDPTYVTTSTSDTYCSGTIMVSSDNFSTCVKMSSSSPASSNDNKTFTLEPYGYLTVSTTYLTRVTTGVKDTAGNAMSSQYETSSGFTTDNTSTEPTVSSVSTTADNQSLVSITDNITVTFSEAMDTTYVTTNTSDTYCSGTIRVSSSSDNFSTGNCVKMSSSPASSNSDKTFTLDPYDNLTRLTTYLTRVTTGVKDTYGNAISSQYESSSGFTTDNGSIIVSNSGLTSGTTYYWKVVASDPKGGSAQSETWSFTVQ